MEEQVPSSQIPNQLPAEPKVNQPLPGQITPEILEAMKARARELAIRQAMEQQAVQPSVSIPQNQRVVYVRRNLTVAELIVVFAIACGLVTGVQALWHAASNTLPRLEIRVK